MFNTTLTDADVIVSLDADFLSGAAIPGFHKLVREYAERRKDPEKLNRLYAIESTPTTTGLKAEHRLGLRASEIPAFAAELAQGGWRCRREAPAYAWTDEQKKFLAALAKDLKASAGKCVVIPGLYQDPRLRRWRWPSTMLWAMWARRSFSPSRCESAAFEPDCRFQGAGADLNAGKVDWLVILNANPIYTAPADLNFADAFNKANIVAHLGSHWTRPARLRTGTFRRRIIWSRGRMRAPTTARFPSCSR
jgi:hypothetical protein